MATGRRKLLLADDSATIRKVVGLTFTDEGLEVTAVSDGDHALRELEEHLPDIVLADALMPGRSGYEVCERIKSDPSLRHIPVILLVGAFEPFNEAEARRVGADEVLTKPFQSIRDLVSKVGSLLGGESKQEEPQAPSARAEADSSEKPAAPVAREAGGFAESGAAPAATGGAAPAHAYDPASSFADLGIDDQLIEATPAERFRGSQAQPSGTAATAAPTPEAAEAATPEPLTATPETLAATPETLTANASSASSHATTEFAAPRLESGREARGAEPGREARAAAEPAFARAAFAANGAHGALSDDVLLDLDDAEPPSSLTSAAAEADDFILDLVDESPASAPLDLHGEGEQEAPAAYSVQISPAAASEPRPAVEASAATDAAGTFAEAAHGAGLDDTLRDYAHATPEPERAQPQERPVEAETRTVEAETQTVEAEAPAAWEVSALTVEAGAPAEAESGAQEASAEKVAAHEFIEPEVVPAEEPVSFAAEEEIGAGESVEGDIARPPLEAVTFDAPRHEGAAGLASEAELTGGDAASASPVAASAAASVQAPGGGGQITLEQLSPEVIEAVARRAVELLSERVVRDVAWDVVPELAERLIKQRLDEERQK